MKKIIILLRETNCDNNIGDALIYDKCNVFVSMNPITYSIDLNVKDIATLANGGSLPLDYSLTVDHIGGRPNDRK